jgi:hypothetical protein
MIIESYFTYSHMAWGISHRIILSICITETTSRQDLRCFKILKIKLMR